MMNGWGWKVKLLRRFTSWDHIADDSRELVVYHGTCSEFEKINLNKSHNRRDFGKGFYTTILQSQSKEWAYRLSLREKRNDYYVYEFLFEEVPSLKVKDRKSVV